MIWENLLANIQNWEQNGLEKLIVYFTLKSFKSMENYIVEQLKILNFVSKNIHQTLP